MSNTRDEACTFCGETATINSVDNPNYHFVQCKVCGRYCHQVMPTEFGLSFKDKIAAYLYYSEHAGKNPSTKNYVFLGSKEDFETEREKYSWVYYASEDEIKAFYPHTFTDRINRILLDIAKKSIYLGYSLTLSEAQTFSAFFIKRFDEQGNGLNEIQTKNQISQIIDYLVNNNFLKQELSNQKSYRFTLKPEGWKRVDELQQQINNSNTVFLAMSFADDMKDTRETIKKAITENGFVPRIMDEIEHNHQIVPEMLYEIRKAKFVIAELTGHNNGAYFEAGYALGCGKEVIQICNKDKFEDDGHFDVKQINTVMWENQNDLFERLNARIKATII